MQCCGLAVHKPAHVCRMGIAAQRGEDAASASSEGLELMCIGLTSLSSAA